MANVYDLHLRTTSLNLPRRRSGERARISGSHPAATSESAWVSNDSGSKRVVSEPPRDAS
jgi:hypothetical protein